MNKEELKEFRKKYNISQRQLGILLGYSHDQIYRLESGQRQLTDHFIVSVNNLGKLLDYEDVKIPK